MKLTSLITLTLSLSLSTLAYGQSCPLKRKAAPKRKPVVVCPLVKPVKPSESRQTPVSQRSADVTQTQTVTINLGNLAPAKQPLSIRPVQKRTIEKVRIVRVKPLEAPKWHVFALAGISRSRFDVSDSSCDANACRGVVTRKHTFDVGIGANYRFGSNMTLGAIVTKESNLYGTVGFSF
jgi:hypothetical protein